MECPKLIFAIALLIGITMATPVTEEQKVTIVCRSEWGAKPPINNNTLMSSPVSYVVIHHADGIACSIQSTCSLSMRGIQNYHMTSKGWNDIGYSFAVGGDGLAYEGRGWNQVGAHTPGYNAKSIGICAIGSFNTIVPPTKQLQAIKDLIAHGVAIGKIKPNYKLIGHRQAVNTKCPGDSLFDEIKTWPNFDSTPDYNEDPNFIVNSEKVGL